MSVNDRDLMCHAGKLKSSGVIKVENQLTTTMLNMNCQRLANVQTTYLLQCNLADHFVAFL